MSTAQAPVSPSTPVTGPPGPARWIVRAMLANLVCQIGIVVTGGLVRVTGSGLGCPTWPECVPGSFVPVEHQEQGYHKYIEFGNRALIFVLVVAAGVALVAAVVHVRRGGAARRFGWWGTAPLWGVVAQAVIGGITVRTNLSALSVAAHFLPSMILIAISTLLYLAVRDPATEPEPNRELRWLTGTLGVLTGVILVMGTIVTGSGPHSGDAGVTDRFQFNPRDVTWLHADVVLLFTGLVIGLVLVTRLCGATAPTRRRALIVAGVTVVQGAVGYLEYATKLPMLLVVLHMFCACLLVVAVSATHAAVFGTRGLVRRP